MDIAELRATLGTIEEKATAGTVLSEELSDRIDAMEDHVDRVEAALLRPTGRLTSDGVYVSPEQRDHADLFLRHLRNPHSRSIRAELEGYEEKAASGLSDSAGGAMVPELIVSRILARVKDGSAMRSIANVHSVGTSDVKLILNNNDATSGWAGETGTRSATAEPTVTPRAPSFGTVYSYVSATEELVQDAQFDIGSWFVDAVSQEIIKAEGTAFISGDGSNKPTGLLNTAPEDVDDGASPARTVEAFKYLPTGDAAGFGSSAPVDTLVTALYDLKSDYRRGAVWVMNSATAGVIRKFKDADGRYLWVDPIAQGQPPILLGYRVVIDEAMPDVAANAVPVLFGDFMRGYGIFDLGGVRITLDDNITTPGFVKWYLRRRVGGCVLDNNSVRAIKCSIS